jgi:hypothetical protein
MYSISLNTPFIMLTKALRSESTFQSTFTVDVNLYDLSVSVHIFDFLEQLRNTAEQRGRPMLHSAFVRVLEGQ